MVSLPSFSLLLSGKRARTSRSELSSLQSLRSERTEDIDVTGSTIDRHRDTNVTVDQCNVLERLKLDFRLSKRIQHSVNRSSGSSLRVAHSHNVNMVSARELFIAQKLRLHLDHLTTHQPCSSGRRLMQASAHLFIPFQVLASGINSNNEIASAMLLQYLHSCFSCIIGRHKKQVVLQRCTCTCR